MRTHSVSSSSDFETIKADLRGGRSANDTKTMSTRRAQRIHCVETNPPLPTTTSWSNNRQYFGWTTNPETESYQMDATTNLQTQTKWTHVGYRSVFKVHQWIVHKIRCFYQPRCTSSRQKAHAVEKWVHGSQIYAQTQVDVWFLPKRILWWLVTNVRTCLPPALSTIEYGSS